jgi:hypothetical protein
VALSYSTQAVYIVDPVVEDEQEPSESDVRLCDLVLEDKFVPGLA